jgi:hypothetical protein
VSVDESFGFATPAFNAADALVALKRHLRDLKVREGRLSERGTGYELGGRKVIDLTGDAQSLTAKLAKKPTQTPEWTTHVMRSQADVRKFQDTVKQQLARWTDSD